MPKIDKISNSSISVIIPTLAEKKRFTAIRRCIDSVRTSSTEPIKIIVVINGARFDDEVTSWIESQPDVNVLRESLPSAPNAVKVGRECVDTEFFSTVDDDDEYLPGSTDLKLVALKATPDIDLVVSNGYRSSGSNDVLMYRALSSVRADPMKALFNENWLNSGNALYRSDSIGNKYFSEFHAYVEWTWLAFRLAIEEKKIAVVDRPCFRINITPNSLSQSQEYHAAYFPLYQRMLNLEPPDRVQKMVKRRIGSAWHDCSTSALERGMFVDAWKAHIRSLFYPGGLRYLSYSRRLIPGWPKS